jgi:hypothetical protein
LPLIERSADRVPRRKRCHVTDRPRRMGWGRRHQVPLELPDALPRRPGLP